MLEFQSCVYELAQGDPDFNNCEVGKSHRLPIPQSQVEINPNKDLHPEY